MASDGNDLTHFDEDPILQTLIQEYLLASLIGLARIQNKVITVWGTIGDNYYHYRTS